MLYGNWVFYLIDFIVHFSSFGSSDFLQIVFMAIVCHCTGTGDFWLFEIQINFKLKHLLKENTVSYFSLFTKLY